MNICETAMPEVDSSVIKRVTYSPGRHELFVFFVTGRAYIYFEVPAEKYDAFLEAPSLGRYFNSRIRDQYRFRELTPSH
jgi:hypothetical protein